MLGRRRKMSFDMLVIAASVFSGCGIVVFISAVLKHVTPPVLANTWPVSSPDKGGEVASANYLTFWSKHGRVMEHLRSLMKRKFTCKKFHIYSVLFEYFCEDRPFSRAKLSLWVD
ncbi:hypothetical protein MANES_05G164701v8 [Manihot esculenta]|uniref:Uncharacterized protein n=1 Tax=Manihot esculenta TaxID=3983 RepID=A0ACB7HPZ4_MANES|nr:hypothetical protein MANES_05G164701v8 [Manihot esculenta]